MRNLILSLILLCSLHSVGQSNWLRKAGGIYSDEASDICCDSSGNYYTCGYFINLAGFDVVAIPSYGLSDAFVFKSDIDGNIEWTLNFGGLGDDRAFSVETDSEGNIYIAGIFSSIAQVGNFTIESEGLHDVFVAKIDSSGNVIWVNSFGGSDEDEIGGLCVTSDGSTYATGSFSGDALFDNYTLSSMLHPETFLPTRDVYIAHLNVVGEVTWVRQGAGPSDEIGNDICCDDFGRVYATGNFSGTIAFETTLMGADNQSSFALSYNEQGDVLWSAIGSAEVISGNAITKSDNQIFLVGDFQGSISYSSALSSGTLSSSFAFNLFIWCLTEEGVTMWITDDGSNTSLSCTSVENNHHGGVFIGGDFNCTFDEYSNDTEDWLFNSAGFRDIFLAEYSSDSNRSLTRQFAGPRSDRLNGITQGNSGGSPILAGSFESFFNVPSNPDFLLHNQIIEPANFDEYYPVSNGECVDPYYDNFQSVLSTGSKDILFFRPIHPQKSTYDFHSHLPNECDETPPEPCMKFCNSSGCSGECLTEFTGCGSTSIGVVMKTGSLNFVSPGYEYYWYDGTQPEFKPISENGIYYCTATSLDNCYTEFFEFEISLFPINLPLVTDDAGYNTDQPPATNQIFVCEDYDTEIFVSNANEGSVHWEFEGEYFYTDTIIASQAGVYQLTFINEFGCTSLSLVEVFISAYLPEQTFQLVGYPSDSISFCTPAQLMYSLYPTPTFPEWQLQTEANWKLYFNNEVISDEISGPFGFFFPEESGWYYVEGTAITYNEFPCEENLTYHPVLTDSIYVSLLPSPENNTEILVSANPICEGDTVIITAINAPNPTWNGPGIIALINDSTIMINQTGDYLLDVSEQFENGCSFEETYLINIQEIDPPYIIGYEQNNTICPGDSILLICNLGLNYEWYSQDGEIIGFEQSIVITEPGQYFCLQTNSQNCSMMTDEISFQIESQPSLFVLPFDDLCFYGEANLIVTGSSENSVQWLPPLSGNESMQLVDEPGTYALNTTYCGSDTTLLVEIIETLNEIELQELDSTWCPGDSIVLVGPPDGAQYLWFPSFTTEQSVTITEPQTVWLQFTNEIGCIATSSPLEIEELILNPPIASSLEVCAGQNLTFTANSEWTINWCSDPEGNSVIGTGLEIYIGTFQNDTVFYAFASEENCTSGITAINISIVENPIVQLSSDQVACEGDELTLYAIPEFEIPFFWTTPQGNNIFSDSLYIPQISMTDSGWYIGSSEAENCQFFDSVFVNVESPESTKLLQAESYFTCVGDTIFIAAPDGYPAYWWQTPNGNWGEQLVIINDAQEFNEGIYALSVPGLACDSLQDQIYVVINNYPSIQLSDSLIWCENQVPVIHIDAYAESYYWNTGSNGPTTTIPSDGLVILTAINQPDCLTIDTLNTSFVTCEVILPNIITPNGDGLNDHIDFSLINFNPEKVVIYNRWGNEIFTITALPWTWNGTDASNSKVGGTFYYILTYKDGSFSSSKDGYIHVLR